MDGKYDTPPDRHAYESAFDAYHVGALTLALAQAEDDGRGPLEFGLATGRSEASVQQRVAEERPLQKFLAGASFMILDVGTTIKLHDKEAGRWTRVADYPRPVGWDLTAVTEILDARPELRPQDESAQQPLKRSYFVRHLADGQEGAYTRTLQAALNHELAGSGLAARVVVSSGEYVDCLPVDADGNAITKGLALRKVSAILEARHAERLASEGRPARAFMSAFGDSPNDYDLLTAAHVAGVVGNARLEVKRHVENLIPPERRFVGTPHQRRAQAALLGLRHFGVLSR